MCSSSSSKEQEESTHFGYQNVKLEEKENLVYVVGRRSRSLSIHSLTPTLKLTRKHTHRRGVFDSVASKYDVMNDLMSGTMHRMWKDHMVSMMGNLFVKEMDEFEEEEDQVMNLLDVAGGTGDIAFRICDAKIAADERAGQGRTRPVNVTVFDINPNMLEEGQKKATQRPSSRVASLDWVEGNAEKLPFEDNSFDAYTIAFGIRNVTNIPLALREAHRVLKPGGRFLCLEFSQVENPLLRAAYTTYSFNVIPEIGQLVAGDRDSYQYLVESIARFPDQETFRLMTEDAGFKGTSFVNMTGGIVAIHTGFKMD